MWIGKIGAKSSAFINHKHFHPSNLQNLKRVWMAEEKQRKEEERLKEIIEKREEERKIQDLRKAMNSTTKEINPKPNYINSDTLDTASNTNIKKKRYSDATNKSLSREQRIYNQSKYKEDFYPLQHTAVWGSYYDTTTGQWGYDCCKSLKRNEICSLSAQSADNDKPSNKRPKPSISENQTKKRKNLANTQDTNVETGLAKVLQSIKSNS